MLESTWGLALSGPSFGWSRNMQRTNLLPLYQELGIAFGLIWGALLAAGIPLDISEHASLYCQAEYKRATENFRSSKDCQMLRAEWQQAMF